MKSSGATVRFTLTKKISLLFLIPVFVSLVSVAFFVGLLEDTKTDGHFMNVAGRQRMLAAELRAWAHMVAIGQEEDRVGLRIRIAEFEKSLSAMNRGGEVLDGLLDPAPPEVRGELAAVDNFWRALKPALTDVAVGPRGDPKFQKAYRRVESGTDELRDLSSRLVTRFEERTQRLRQRMLYTLVSAACLTGIAFLAGVFLTRRYIVQPILRVEKAARRIAGGDLSQRLDIATRDELSVLAYTFNQMVAQTEQLLRALNLRRRHAETIIASVPAGLLVLRDDLAVLRANRSFRETFGVDEQAIARRPMVTELLPVNGLEEAALEVLSTGEAKRNLTMEMPAKDGSPRLLRITLAGTRLAEEEEEEEEARLLVVVEDVTAEHELRAQARVHEQRFHDLVQGLDAIVWEAEVRGEQIVFTFMSRHAEALLGWPVQRWLGHELWPAIVHPDDRDAVFDFYNRVLKSDPGAGEERGRYEIEYRVHKADGGLIWLHDVVHLASGVDGVGRLRGVTVDVTARKDMESRLVHLASHDALTGLPNRNLLHDRLSQALVYAARHQRTAAVLFLDLDRFKFVNDSLGHSMGDRLLQAVAERLRDGMRAGDTVARVGGDEFVVVLEDMARSQDAALIAQKMLERFAPPFRVEDPQAGTQELYFTTSIGVSLYPGDGDDPHVLLKNADIAMYRAKERGGNNYQFFAPEMDAQARKRLSLENALHHALAQEQFVLHYQPQVELATGRVLGVEALLRWNRPHQGLVAPGDFIPLLEETGLIVPVGDWVLRASCAQHRAWREAGLPPLRMAVNLSARQLRHERFAETVAEALADTGMDPNALELEITESAVMQQVEESLETLRRIRALGVHLSMDDFGTGYSSLSHLKLFPIGAVKIDQSFVRDIPADENDAAIVEAIIVLARTLRLNVIAEGVETEAQLAFLRAHGCRVAQGFLFSRPVPAAELTARLRTPEL